MGKLVAEAENALGLWEQVGGFRIFGENKNAASEKAGAKSIGAVSKKGEKSVQIGAAQLNERLARLVA